MTQSSWSDIVERVAAQMGTVANIGRVWDHTKLVIDEETLVATMRADVGGEQVLRAWMCHLEIPRASAWESQGGTVDWDRLIVIEGFLQLDLENDSEKTAIALGEAVIRVLNNDLRTTRLGGTVLTGHPAGFPSGHRPAEPRLFGFVMCHYLRIQMPVLTVETP